VPGSCKYGDEPAGSGTTDLVSWLVFLCRSAQQLALLLDYN